MNESDKHLTSFAGHLTKQYGKRGTTTREEYEKEFENFKLGVMMQEPSPNQHRYLRKNVEQ